MICEIIWLIPLLLCFVNLEVRSRTTCCDRSVFTAQVLAPVVVFLAAHVCVFTCKMHHICSLRIGWSRAFFGQFNMSDLSLSRTVRRALLAEQPNKPLPYVSRYTTEHPGVCSQQAIRRVMSSCAHSSIMVQAASIVFKCSFCNSTVICFAHASK